MGRPLNKRYFADAVAGPTAAGSEIKVNFNSGGGVKEGFIVKQKATKKFVVSEIGAADTTHICKLAWGKLPAALASGEMIISFLMDDGETYGVSKISGRKATLAKPSPTGANAYDGKSVPWNFTASLADGAAQVEEAGDDDAAGVDDDDFTDDA